MTPDEFKALVKSKGTQAEVARATGYSVRQIESLCRGLRVIHKRHIKAVQALPDIKFGK